METTIAYPPDHWLRGEDPQAMLAASRRQQSLAYSRAKNAFLFELLGDLSGLRVLDYGCGTGWLTVGSAKRGAALAVGLDSLAPPLRAARLLAGLEGVARRCLFAQAADPGAVAGKLRFQAVILRDVLEHVPDDLGLLQRLAGLLAPGACLVLATQNARSLNYALEGSIRRMLLGQRNWLGWDSTHLRFYTPQSLSRLLARAGLRVNAWRSAYLVPNKIPVPPGSGRDFLRLECLSALDRRLGRFPPFDRLGFSLMARAQA